LLLHQLKIETQMTALPTRQQSEWPLSLNRDQFLIVLATLRARVREGEWLEGEPLVVSDLADACGVSATPVREALSRLAGEALIEDRRGRGYHARYVDGVELADLYRAQAALGQIALSCGDAVIPPPPPSQIEFMTAPVEAWESLFETVISLAESNFLILEQRRLADRLAPARRAEPTVLAETAADFEPLLSAWSAGDRNGLRVVLSALLRRRIHSSELLARRMRLKSPNYNSSI
jgi:hypothetical protein